MLESYITICGNKFLLKSDKSNGLLHKNYVEYLCASFWSDWRVKCKIFV